MNETLISRTLPVLALRGMCVFPMMTTHFDVERPKSVKAIDEAMHGDQQILLIAQRDVQKNDPGFSGLCAMGTVATIKQVLKLPGDVVRVLVEGNYRAVVASAAQTAPYLRALVDEVAERSYNPSLPKVEALVREALELFSDFIDLAPHGLQEMLSQALGSTDPAYVSDFIAQHASFHYMEKQKALEQLHPVKRLEMVIHMLAKELDVLQLQSELQEKVQENVNRGQRDYYLREQLHVIHEQLGDEDEEDEPEQYRLRIAALGLPQETEEKLLKEVSRMAKQPAGSSEASLLRNYLDTCLDLPWNETTKERLDLRAARRILDEDHYGLEQVKTRIMEMLAVKKLAPDMPGPILCLVGPPGVGKTSVAISIARCLNRNLARISLGGVHDEADIRGHRKTYIGAMPGRIISGVLQAKTRNPLLLLDEIDKMGSDYRGDPSAALLEVLDSEQNTAFRDHYLEVPFDLSDCMFITTANTTETIPRALLDRMEVIELGSYTDEEKLRIAKGHLLPKQMKKHGITRGRLRLTDGAIREIITCYTRESGVRNLERELARVCRKTAVELVAPDAPGKVTVTGSNLETYLGIRKYLPDKMPERDPVGLVTGLAWTSVGGETLEVEVNVVDGTGKLELTGNLGDVMKESAGCALSYIRSRTAQYGIDPEFYKKKDIHVHFPEGAIPKDGPSAGITICTAMVSALTGATVRRDIAMTGEISIRGRVLPIGGLKEKTMAALRHGIKMVVIPQDNAKDLEEIDQNVRKALNFITVSHADSVIEAALDFTDVPQLPKALDLTQSDAIPAPRGKRKAGIRQ
ncbi:MAG: endopeptidase La [Oscillospiraceae bacterium]|nr:endopeptidase La [Oscillospiraceae bacterium]